ncbi:MAG: UDP-glucose--hexose-1-phosphate uridylyltransferase [Parvularculaceae bacterium]|nr:UDP-glucose--hexose-1-phosphate uridylyltransferase [Parvularculaceae bacterium]
MTFDPGLHPHRRRNLLTGRHVLVSPQRALRPWLGRRESPDLAKRPRHDPACYLCPGNARAEGAMNPLYTDVFVFDNDFAALLADAPDPRVDDALFPIEPAHGACRVVCFSPDHALTLAEAPEETIGKVIDAWIEETRLLGGRFPSVQVFENKGEMMGCSNPHPHGQIWATSFAPDEIAVEDRSQSEWFAARGAPLLAEVAEREAHSPRMVCVNHDWVAFVPFWASWPFETLLVPRFDARRLVDVDDARRRTLAETLKRLLVAYDNLFECSFPYSMGWHGAPFDGGDAPHWRLHAHFYPPLLRSASVRKFMVGFEMLGEAQRDITPESAAARLRETDARHYRTRGAA